MRNILLLFSFVFFGFFFASRASAQQLQWQSWTDSAAQGTNSEQQMALDGYGNVWILYDYDTALGYTVSVGKFDGTNWMRFGPGDAGLMGGALNSIARDHNGDVWVSGDSGIAKFSQEGGWHTYTIQDRLTGERGFYALAADSSGNIWVTTNILVSNYINQSGIEIDSTFFQLFRFDGTNWKEFTPLYLYDWFGFRALSVASSGVLWAGGEDSANTGLALWKFEGGKWTSVSVDTSGIPVGPYQTLSITSLHADGNGGAWVGFGGLTDLISPSGLKYFNGFSWVTSALTDTRFSHVWLAPNGNQYFVSRNASDSLGGLIIANDNGIIDSIPKSSIPVFPIDHIEFSTNGLIWASAFGGHCIQLEESAALSSVTLANPSNSTLQCSVYPNPMIADAAHLSLSGAESGVYRITLTNTLGIVLKTASVNASGTATCDFSTSDLASGAYLITIANGAERVTVPVVKE
jgi:hypothetical protein